MDSQVGGLHTTLSTAMASAMTLGGPVEPAERMAGAWLQEEHGIGSAGVAKIKAAFDEQQMLFSVAALRGIGSHGERCSVFGEITGGVADGGADGGPPAAEEEEEEEEKEEQMCLIQ